MLSRQALARATAIARPHTSATDMSGRKIPKKVRTVALLIWFLSRQSDLAMSYVMSRGQDYDLDDVNLFSAGSVAAFLVNWLADVPVREALHAGLSALENGDRTVADQYLMHSVLVEYIINQNRKGLAVDLVTVIAKYIRLWTFRPISHAVKRRLAKLVWHRATRRRFGVNLRREWALCFNNFDQPRDLTANEIRAKVRQSSLSVQQTDVTNDNVVAFIT